MPVDLSPDRRTATPGVPDIVDFQTRRPPPQAPPRSPNEFGEFEIPVNPGG